MNHIIKYNVFESFQYENDEEDIYEIQFQNQKNMRQLLMDLVMTFLI